MKKLKNIYNNFTKQQKITCLITCSFVIILLLVAVPTLSLLNGNADVSEISFWDKSVASSYNSGNGSSSNPYVISNGSELAYFASELENNDYNNTYFVLDDNIYLNKGTFSYDTEWGITYYLDNNIYYVDPFTGEYFDSKNKLGSKEGTVNIFPNMDSFKGTLNAKGYSIYGAFVSSESDYEVSLFTNFKGTIKNLQVVNNMIYGGTITGGLIGISENATLNNVLVEGYVVGTNVDNKTETVKIDDVLLTMENNLDSFHIDLINSLPFTGGKITNVVLSGNAEALSGDPTEMEVTINDLSIEIENSPTPFDPITIEDINNILVNYSIQNESGSFALTDLEYTLDYESAITGGIIGKADNTQVSGLINKSKTFGIVAAGGLIGVSTGKTSITNSYNIESVHSDYASGGLIGIIEKGEDVNVLRSYNTSDFPLDSNKGGLVGIIFNSNEVSLINTFDVSNNYVLGSVSSNVTVENLKYTSDTLVGNGNINGQGTKVTKSNLKTKSTLIEMGFSEFKSKEDLESNKNSVWVYQDSYPILYNDNDLTPSAQIYVASSSFNTLNNHPGVLPLTNVTFIMEPINTLKPLKEIYYYISDSEIPLTPSELNNINTWAAMNMPVQIEDEGSYIVYAKIVDTNNKVSYINTDVLIVDQTPPVATVTLVNQQSWTDLRTNLNNISLVIEEDLIVDATDSLSGIGRISYYANENVLTESELDLVDDKLWKEYEEKIGIPNQTNIIYIKIEDKVGNYIYINTDYITINGYVYTSFNIGTNANSYSNTNSITDKSKISYKISYSDSSTNELLNHTHNFVSNTLLPENTKITMYDHVSSMVYEFIVPNNSDEYGYNESCESGKCKAVYPFSLFKEISNINNIFYDEKTYYTNGTGVEEEYTFVISFENTNVSNNYYDINTYIELNNDANTEVRSTISSTVESFNVIKNIEGVNSSADLKLTSSKKNGNVIFNRDSYLEVNLKSFIDYKTFNESKIIDTKYENMKMGLYIRLTKSNGEKISGELFKDMSVKIGNNIYSPDAEGIVKYLFDSGIKDTNSTVKLETYNHESNLDPGTYHLKILSFVSYDGLYEGSTISSEVSIPVVVLDDEVTTDTYSFDLVMNASKHVITKSNGDTDINFNLILSESFSNPNIRVSLFQKDELTAYNQKYSIVDLENFITNKLNKHSNNIYYVPVDQSEFTLNLDIKSFDYNGYKIVFDLYDGDRFIDQVRKYIIVK